MLVSAHSRVGTLTLRNCGLRQVGAVHLFRCLGGELSCLQLGLGAAARCARVVHSALGRGLLLEEARVLALHDSGGDVREASERLWVSATSR